MNILSFKIFLGKEIWHAYTKTTYQNQWSYRKQATKNRVQDEHTKNSTSHLPRTLIFHMIKDVEKTNHIQKQKPRIFGDLVALHSQLFGCIQKSSFSGLPVLAFKGETRGMNRGMKRIPRKSRLGSLDEHPRKV